MSTKSGKNSTEIFSQGKAHVYFQSSKLMVYSGFPATSARKESSAATR